MMRLCAACRNTSVRRTTGTAPDVMTSASTWPGPTEGSWSMPPTTVISLEGLKYARFLVACAAVFSAGKIYPKSVILLT
jgi:hypothetical protein